MVIQPSCFSSPSRTPTFEMCLSGSVLVESYPWHLEAVQADDRAAVLTTNTVQYPLCLSQNDCSPDTTSK